MPEEKPKYKRPRTEAQRAGEKRYKAKAEVAYSLRLNRSTDSDIINRIEQIKIGGGSVQGFIKRCIRAYVNADNAITIRMNPDEAEDRVLLDIFRKLPDADAQEQFRTCLTCADHFHIDID